MLDMVEAEAEEAFIDGANNNTSKQANYAAEDNGKPFFCFYSQN